MKDGVVPKLLLLPAAVGFAALFGLNFVLITAALVSVSAGLLCAPVGILYCFGLLRVVSDLSAPALSAMGFFCLFSGIFLCFFILRFAPFCKNLFSRYAALLTGKRFHQVCFPKKRTRIMRLSLIFAGVSLAAAALLQLWAVFNGFESTVVRDSIVFTDTKYLKISTTNLDFELKYYDGEGILVEYVNDAPMIIKQSDQDYLKLVQDDSFTLSLFAADQFGYKMTVYLPENDYREFYLDSGSGNITLTETQSQYTEIHTRSGSITVTEADQKLSAATVSGDITCQYTAFVNAGTFQSSYGDISITMPDYSGVTLVFETESGWVESPLLGINKRLYGSVELEKEAPLSHYLYVTADSGGLFLGAASG